jgi:hypothetical protein
MVNGADSPSPWKPMTLVRNVGSPQCRQGRIRGAMRTIPQVSVVVVVVVMA